MLIAEVDGHVDWDEDRRFRRVSWGARGEMLTDLGRLVVRPIFQRQTNKSILEDKCELD